MEFVILLIINLIFCGGIYWLFRIKINEAIGTDKIREEIEELVILFNRQAETNISTLEAKLTEVSNLVEENKNNLQNKIQIPKLKKLKPEVAPVDFKEITQVEHTDLKLQDHFSPSSVKDIISISKESKHSIIQQQLLKKKSYFEKNKENSMLTFKDKLTKQSKENRIDDLSNDEELNQTPSKPWEKGIIRDYREGKNLKEIAEKYQMSTDEIKLRINLIKKSI